MADNFDKLNQKELRAACKAAGMKGYSDLKLDALRDMLREHAGTSTMDATDALNADIADAKPRVTISDADKRQIAEQAKAPLPKDAHYGPLHVWNGFEMSEEELAKQNRTGRNEEQQRQDAIVEGRTANLAELGEAGLNDVGRCPHCGVPTLDNVAEGVQVVANGGDAKRSYVCEDCGGEWGPLLPMADKAYANPTGGVVADVRDGNCPACDIHLSNGLLSLHDEAANMNGKTLWQVGQLQRDYECMGCGHQWGRDHGPYKAPRDPNKPTRVQKPSGTSTGLNIEPNRPTRNGVTRPSAGGKCRAVWDGLDAAGAATTAKEARELAKANGWDNTTTMVQFYRWRKFNGIAGR